MTNEMIIYTESARLMRDGKLKGIGEFIQMEFEDGIKEVELPEPIHTFNGWKQRGFTVKKGQKSSIKFAIWNHSVKKIKDENGEERNEPQMYMKMSAFFTSDQVEPIKSVS